MQELFTIRLVPQGRHGARRAANVEHSPMQRSKNSRLDRPWEVLVDHLPSVGPSRLAVVSARGAAEAALPVASARRTGRAARGSEGGVENAGEGGIERRVSIDVLCMFDVLRDGGVVAALEDLVDQWCVARSPLPLG